MEVAINLMLFIYGFITGVGVLIILILLFLYKMGRRKPYKNV